MCIPEKSCAFPGMPGRILISSQAMALWILVGMARDTRPGHLLQKAIEHCHRNSGFTH